MRIWGAGVAFLAGVVWNAMAGEVAPLAGKVEPAPVGQFFSNYLLRDAESGILISGLKDPRGLLSPGRDEVIVEGELQDGPEVNGLPIYVVVDLLPEYWEQPATWSLEPRDVAEFAGARLGIQAKDFAGAPFSFVRAYNNDNGLVPARPGLPTDFVGTPGLQIGTFSPTSDGFFATFQVFAGLQYELLSATSLDETPQTIATSFAAEDGMLTLSAPLVSGNAFFLIRASAP